MNVFILTDLEGVAGVERFAQTRADGDPVEKRKAMELLTGEVNAAVKAIKDIDPGIKIHVWDGHGSGGILPSRLHRVERYIPPGRVHLPRYFRKHEIAALLFVGQHAMSYTFNGNLCHTMSSRHVEYYMLNGRLIGEFGLRAAIAGELGVPTIYLSGDDKACAEARSFVPGIVTTAVKKGTGWESAGHLPVQEARDNIYRDVQEAMKKIHDIEPFVVETPVELEKCFKSWVQLAGLVGKGYFKKGTRNIVFREPSMEALVDKGLA